MQVLADGRVRRSETEWQQVLARFEASGLSVARFCQREGIARGSFVRWRQQVERTRRSGTAAFVELLAPASVGDPSLAVSVALELSLPGGVVLRWMRSR